MAVHTVEHRPVDVDSALLACLEAIDLLPDWVTVKSVEIGRFPGEPIEGADTHWWRLRYEVGLSSSPAWNDPSAAVPGRVEVVRPARVLAIEAAATARTALGRWLEAEDAPQPEPLLTPSERKALHLAVTLANGDTVSYVPPDGVTLAPETAPDKP